jgi:hypothetical protein
MSEMLEQAVIDAISEWVGETTSDHLVAAARAAITTVRCSADSAGDTGTLEKVTSIIERHVPHDEAVHMAGDIIDLISPEIGRLREKLSSALSGGLPHSSDCAVYNAPAYEPGPCDCGMLNEPQSLPLRGPDCACCEQRPRKDCTVPGCTMKDAGWALERSQAESVLVPKPALDWLFGVGPGPDGKSFDDDQDAEERTPRKYSRRYWWRSKFSSMIPALTRPQCATPTSPGASTPARSPRE